MDGLYAVRFESFAKTHFIKKFEKKYQTQWDFTLRAITAEFERVDALLKTDKAETICHANGVLIIKTQFKVAGTKESAKSSGNRCIIAWHREARYVSVLLVYGKTDLAGRNETAQWKSLVRDNYPEYKGIF